MASAGEARTYAMPSPASPTRKPGAAGSPLSPPRTTAPPVRAPAPGSPAGGHARMRLKRAVTGKGGAADIQQLSLALEDLWQTMAEVRERYVLRPEFDAALSLKADASEPRRAIAELRDDMDTKADLETLERLLRGKVDQTTFKGSVNSICKRQLGDSMTTFRGDVLREARSVIDSRIEEALDFQVANVERLQEMSAFVIRLDAMDQRIAQLLAGRETTFERELKRVAGVCDEYVGKVQEIAEESHAKVERALEAIDGELGSMRETVSGVVEATQALDKFKSDMRTDLDMAVSGMKRQIASALQRVQKANEEESKAFEHLERRFEVVRQESSNVRRETQRELGALQQRQQTIAETVERSITEMRMDTRKLKEEFEDAMRHANAAGRETREIHRRLNRLDAKVQTAAAPMRSIDMLKRKVARMPQQLAQQGIVIPATPQGGGEGGAPPGGAWQYDPPATPGFGLRAYPDEHILDPDPPATGKEMDAVKERVSKLESEYRRSLHRGVETLDGLRGKLDTVSQELADTRKAASDMHAKVEECTAELVNLKAENETLLFELARHQEQQREMHQDYSCLLQELRTIHHDEESDNWINPMASMFRNQHPSRAEGNAATAKRAATASSAATVRAELHRKIHGRRGSPSPAASPSGSPGSAELPAISPSRFATPRVRLAERIEAAALRRDNVRLRQQIYLARSPSPSPKGSPTGAGAAAGGLAGSPEEHEQGGQGAGKKNKKKKKGEVDKLKDRMARTVKDLTSWDPAAPTKGGRPAAYPHLPDMGEL